MGLGFGEEEGGSRKSYNISVIDYPFLFPATRGLRPGVRVSLLRHRVPTLKWLLHQHQDAWQASHSCIRFFFSIFLIVLVS
jgi:hypothetical protein